MTNRKEGRKKAPLSDNQADSSYNPYFNFEDNRYFLPDNSSLESQNEPGQISDSPQCESHKSASSEFFDQNFCRKFYSLPSNAENAYQDTYFSWRDVIQILSRFFHSSIVEKAVGIVHSMECVSSCEMSPVLCILGAIEFRFRSNHFLISHKVLTSINRLLNLQITKQDLNKAYFQVCEKSPYLDAPDPHRVTNYIIRRLACKVGVDYVPDFQDKKWAVQQIILIAQEMLDMQFSPTCPEVYGYALALFVVNSLDKINQSSHFHLPSDDPTFCLEVDMAVEKLKKLFSLERSLDINSQPLGNR